MSTGSSKTSIYAAMAANVAIAVEAGMNEAERIGELNSVMVIPRPLGDLERSLPKTQKAKTQEPVRLPLKLEERQKVEERQKELVPAKVQELEPLKREAVVVPEVIIPELETEEL